MTAPGLLTEVTDGLRTVGFKTGWRVVRTLPEPVAYGLFNRIADLVHRRGGKGVERLRANYRRARPELDEKALDELVHAGLRSYMRYYCEAFRLPSLSREQINGAVRVVGDEEPRTFTERGETVIAFVGHLGNFDLAAAWGAGSLAPVTTVAERLKPEAVFREFVAYRNAIDMEIIPLTGGDDPFTGLLRTARAGGRVIALASDRDLTRHGVEVDLIGRPARMAKGPAVLSLMTGAPLYAAAIHYEPATDGGGLGGYRTVIEFSQRLFPRVDGTTAAKAQDLIQQCADHISGTILAHTESWHMLQRVFVEDLSDRRDTTRETGRAAGEPSPTTTT